MNLCSGQWREKCFQGKTQHIEIGKEDMELYIPHRQWDYYIDRNELGRANMKGNMKGNLHGSLAIELIKNQVSP